MPNKDLQESKILEAEIRQNSENRKNAPEEGVEKAALSNKGDLTLWGMMFVVALWAMAYPHPYNLPIWICFAVPWLAIILCWQNKSRPLKDRQMSMLMLTWLSVIGLVLSAAQSMRILPWIQAIVPGIPTGIAFMILVGFINNWFGNIRIIALRFFLFYCLILCCGGYGIGAIIWTNMLLDDSVPAKYQVQVLEHHEIHGKTTTFYVTVSNWGQSTSHNEFQVDRNYYQLKAIGSMACVYMHNGAYHMPWYNLEDCAKDETPAAKVNNNASQSGECFWMENYSGKFTWVSAGTVQHKVLTKKECFSLDSCDGGQGLSGGGCYKWATAPDGERAPW